MIIIFQKLIPFVATIAKYYYFSETRAQPNKRLCKKKPYSLDC